MSTEYEALRELMARHGLLSLFTKRSLRERIHRVRAGLKAEKGSGEYKYARLQLVRLSAPLSAVMVPLLAVLLLTLLARAIPEHSSSMIVEMIPEEPAPEPLDPNVEVEIDPLETPTPTDVETLPDTPMTVDEPNVLDTPAVEPVADIVERFTVDLTRSPVYFPGPFGPRGDPGGRDEAMETFDAPGNTEDAVIRALRWLQAEQLPDGSWAKTKPAMTGLALLAFLGHGEKPESEAYGETVLKAIQWLVNNQESSGLFRGRDGHNYSHPIATYALCEAFALTQVPMVREAAEKALAVVVEGQHSSGGGDYNCKQSTRDDTSYMGWCVQALKAAKMGGLEHPGLDAAMARAVKGMQKNAHPQGGFGYTRPGQGGLTGVGVLCMQMLGAGHEPEARRGLANLLQTATFDWQKPWGGSPMYYWYYATQAHFFAGGSAWEKWNPGFAHQLVRGQTVLRSQAEGEKNMGYWDSPGQKEHSDGRVQDTCLATLQLEVYYRYLRTQQRPGEREEENDLATGQKEVKVQIVI